MDALGALQGMLDIVNSYDDEQVAKIALMEQCLVEGLEESSGCTLATAGESLAFISGMAMAVAAFYTDSFEVATHECNVYSAAATFRLNRQLTA